MENLTTWQVLTQPNEMLNTVNLESETVLSDYNHFALLAISGKDARIFLQGQLTCDMQEVNEHIYRLACCCTVKGRMLSSFLVFYHNETFYLIMPRSLIDVLIQHLKKYAIFSKVEFIDLRDSYCGFIVAGLEHQQLMNSHFKTLNGDDTFFALTDNIFLIYQKHLSAWQVWAPFSVASQLWKCWATQTKILNPTAWHLKELQAHHIHLSLETVEKFTPHDVNFQQLNGISFTKGCYMGQEVIARMQYLGKLKQHLYAFIVESTVDLTAGEYLYADVAVVNPVGQIVDVEKNNNEYFSLISLKDSAAETTVLYTAKTHAVKILKKC